MSDSNTPGVTVEHVSQKTWNVGWRVEKYLDREANEIEGLKPDETVIIEDNGLLNNGITALLDLLAGGGTYPAFNNANTNLGVGDSTTAFSAAHTDLQAAVNKLFKAMDATYPQVAAQTITFRATFGSAEANFAWEEMGVKNGAGAVSGTVKLLNRRVATAGTKAAGSTWTLTLTITIS
jgi:hypothetical protein